MATTYFGGVGHRVYVRSLGDGPVLRTTARLNDLTVSHDLCDVTSWGGPPTHIAGQSRLEMRLTAYGSDTRPTGDHLDLPLIERLALAVLDGDDTAVYPLIDEFLLTRNR